MKIPRFVFVILRPIWNIYKHFANVDRKRVHRYFAYDEERFFCYAGAKKDRREGLLAELVVSYHVAEKGLTMPGRRLGFGHDHMIELMRLIRSYDKEFGIDDSEVQYAISVVKAYLSLHEESKYDMSKDPKYWDVIKEFVDDYRSVPAAQELHFTSGSFYAQNMRDFDAFARSRHCVRNYSSIAVSVERIKQVVELAQTSPSACNRQHVRVYCLTNKDLIQKVLNLQGGNRGFGHLADKVLIVVGDLADILLSRERNDVYVNGGMFLMNLCYALHYNKIAHCILTWGQDPEKDIKLRQIVPIKPNEEVIALLSCGNPPDEFDVAVSPRRSVESVFRIIE